MTQVKICCGAGGTGKTTTAAALGMAHALAGHRTVVLTIDPARRLANALGLDALANEPSRIRLAKASGTLDALMLDRKRTWDEVIRRYADSPDIATRLLANRYYRAISTRLSGGHEYMAIEKLHELVSLNKWDVIIVDTPPAQHAVDFFKAPRRLLRILDRSALQLLIQPNRGLVGLATRQALAVVQRLAGREVMSDIAEFFELMSSLSQVFRQHSREVEDILTSPQTSVFLIANADAPERDDLLGFLNWVRGQDIHFAGFLLNRVARLPPSVTVDALPMSIDGVNAAQWSAWRQGLAAVPVDQQARADRHRGSARLLARRAGNAPVWLVPEVPHGIRSVGGLATLAGYLPPAQPARL